MSNRWRKKAVVIEAVQFDGTNGNEIAAFMGCEAPYIENGGLMIGTLEGVMRADKGDWVIKGVKGEFYPCKPDIFERTYESEDCAGPVDFGSAVKALKSGHMVSRSGWNGKGMFVYLVPANGYAATTPAAKAYFGEDAKVPYNAYLAIKNVNDTVSTWVPSINDVLAEDWIISRV